MVEVGDEVKKGDKLMEMDLSYIKGQGYSTISPCIISNMDIINHFEPVYGQVKGGETPVILYKSKLKKA